MPGIFINCQARTPSLAIVNVNKFNAVAQRLPGWRAARQFPNTFQHYNSLLFYTSDIQLLTRITFNLFKL